jgi:hypothetical protein
LGFKFIIIVNVALCTYDGMDCRVDDLLAMVVWISVLVQLAGICCVFVDFALVSFVGPSFLAGSFATLIQYKTDFSMALFSPPPTTKFCLVFGYSATLEPSPFERSTS